MGVPKYDELFNPLIEAIRNVGGSASIQEQTDEVADILNLSEKDVDAIHRGNRTKLNYRLAWARNYLKRYGTLENSSRGVWALTPVGHKTPQVDKEEVKKFVVALDRKEKPETRTGTKISGKGSSTWEEELLVCVRNMSPDGFERLSQRLLRESGFIQVEVTGRSNDGGIDGKGVVRLGGLMSFHMIFQCKRFKGSVGSSIVRDFRGAMVGRADKGLVITTGSFTSEARKEAQRDGAPPIDLIDGDTLVQKLKELRLGVEVRERTIEEVSVVPEYFATV